RLTRPLLPEEPEAEDGPAPSAPTLRVGLFNAPDGKPATAARIYFTCNSDFKIVAASGDVVHDNGKSQHQWEVTFRPENNIVELRDNSRNIQYTSKQSFRIVPTGRQGSVLIKSAVFKDSIGIDIGDREVRGSLDILPNPYGFKLVNEANMEEYLYGVVSAGLPHGSPSDAYKAQAVVSRTRALWEKAHRQENLERMDICDSAACQKYMGLSEEMREAALAVRATQGIYLTQNGEVARVLQHDNCGGITEDGSALGAPQLVSVSDGEKPIAATRSADQLELWTHEYPAADRYCEASGLTPPVESRWMRVLSAADISRRAEAVRYLGAIRHMHAAKRAASGRILALEIVGAKDTIVLEGDKAIADVLSPGSLRSTLFTIQPLMSGSKADRFILWGAGTGHGVGLCRAGALGQASMGRKWDAIIKHYFPRLQLNLPVEKRPAAAAAKSAAPAAGRRKPKNPHWNRQ
ncbi:MAG: SpoIID/LytB domain-containing protein, partial [Elusimicrobiota bacterium]